MGWPGCLPFLLFLSCQLTKPFGLLNVSLFNKWTDYCDLVVYLIMLGLRGGDELRLRVVTLPNTSVTALFVILYIIPLNSR